MKRRVRSGSHGGYRDVSGFNNRTEVVIDDALVTEALKLFSLPTLLHCCYGCKGKVCQKPSDPVHAWRSL